MLFRVKETPPQTRLGLGLSFRDVDGIAKPEAAARCAVVEGQKPDLVMTCSCALETAAIVGKIASGAINCDRLHGRHYSGETTKTQRTQRFFSDLCAFVVLTLFWGKEAKELLITK